MLQHAPRPVWTRSTPCTQRTRPLQAFANPYKVLQISETADPTQIKRAYRKLALKHHPDISDHPLAEQEFVKIQQAYEALTKSPETQQAESGKDWDFHDWYWDFMSSSRWNRQWKQHGQAGPAPFAATPSHRNQWHAQLGRLKQKAAYRRAKQQAQAAHDSHSQPWAADRTQQSDVSSDAQQPHQQHAEHINTGSYGGNAEASVSSRSATARHQVEHSPELNPSSGLDHQHSKSAGRMSKVGEADSSDVVTAMSHASACDAHMRSHHSETPMHTSAETNQPLRHGLHGQTDTSQATLGTNVQHQVVAQSDFHIDDEGIAFPACTPAAETPLQEDSSVHSRSDVHIGTPSYSHTIEDTSKTPTDRVQSQLIGLRRRAARKAPT